MGFFYRRHLLLLLRKQTWVCEYVILFPLKWILSLDFEAIMSIHVQKQLYVYVGLQTGEMVRISPYFSSLTKHSNYLYLIVPSAWSCKYSNGSLSAAIKNLFSFQPGFSSQIGRNSVQLTFDFCKSCGQALFT